MLHHLGFIETHGPRKGAVGVPAALLVVQGRSGEAVDFGDPGRGFGLGDVFVTDQQGVKECLVE